MKKIVPEINMKQINKISEALQWMPPHNKTEEDICRNIAIYLEGCLMRYKATLDGSFDLPLFVDPDSSPEPGAMA